MANDIRINILINRSGDPFEEIKQDLRSIKDAVEETTRATQEAGRKGTTRWTELRSAVSLAQEGFQKVRAAAEQAWETIGEGAELQFAEQQFQNLAASIGTTADVLLGEMKVATDGMVSNSQLIASANDLISLKLAKSQDEVVRLAKVSGALGWEMNTLSMVFNNMSWKRLDTLGLAVEDVDEKFEALRQTMSDDEAFRFAVIEAAEERIELAGDQAETTAGKIRMMEAAWQDASDAFKQSIASAAAEDLGIAADSAKDTSEAVTFLAGLFGETLPAAIKQAVRPIVDINRELAFVQVAIDKLGAGQGEFGKGQRESAAATDDLTMSFEEQLLASRELAQEQRYFNEIRERARLRAIEQAEAEDLLQLSQLNGIEVTNEHATKIFEWSEAGWEAVEVSRYWAESNAALEAQMGGPFVKALDGAYEGGVDFVDVMMRAAAQSGASAEALGILAAATGNYTDEQIKAAIETAAMIAKAEQLGRRMAEDATFSAEDALEAFRNFREEILNPYEAEIVAETDKALGDIEEVETALEEAARTYYAEFHVVTIGGVPQLAPGENIPEAAGGGSYRAPGRTRAQPSLPETNYAMGTQGIETVPGAFGQPFPVTLHGGEQFWVGQQNQAPAGPTYQDNRTINNYYTSREAAALGMAQAQIERDRLFDAGAGSR